MIFEELEFQLINILIAIGSIIIIYFAWKSTNVREERLPPTAVLIIENNRRRLLENIVRPQVSQARESLSESNNSTSPAHIDNINSAQQESIETIQIAGAAPSLQEVIDEVNDLAATGAQRTNSDSNYRSIESVEEDINELLEENDNDTDQQQIISDMDNPDTAEGLRRRRLAFYTQETFPDESTNTSTSRSRPIGFIAETTITRENLNIQSGDFTHTENCSNENNENENISKSGEIRSEGQPLRPIKPTAPPISHVEGEITDEFRIKLKYLNDDLRLVKGSPNEEIGDFKKRNFTVELAAQKLVRLVFNGHVLQPDSKTLQACGLFDNCVVHCLVHKKPTSANSTENPNSSGSQQRQTGEGPQEMRNIGASSFLDANTNGPLFIYLGIAMVTLAIIFCWYCRIQYSSLFSLYSTIGLVLMTALFLIIFPLVILIERDVST